MRWKALSKKAIWDSSFKGHGGLGTLGEPNSESLSHCSRHSRAAPKPRKYSWNAYERDYSYSQCKEHSPKCQQKEYRVCKKYDGRVVNIIIGGPAKKRSDLPELYSVAATKKPMSQDITFMGGDAKHVALGLHDDILVISADIE